VYPFYTSLTGSLGIVQAGLGTTSLQPLYGPNTFTGPVAVNAGTLATTGTAAALAGAASIAVNAGGTLLLGQTGGVNDAASVTLAGGVLRTGVSLSETLSALNITTGGSIIDFLGTASTLNFSTLSLGGPLAIWNYAGANDFLTINSGTATGSLAQIQFFSDSGSTFLGWGGFEGTRLVPVPVPEPSTIAMALAGIACGCWMVRPRTRPSTRGSAARVVVMLLGSLAFGSESRAAVVLFDNLGETGGGYSSLLPVSVAQAFTTTSTAHVLDEVSLPLWKRGEATGAYDIQLWDSTGNDGTPGAQVGSAIFSGLAQNLSTTPGALLTIPNLNITLSPNTTYYLVSGNTSVTPTDNFMWALSDTNASNFLEFSEGIWNGPYPSNLKMRITAVPEPSTVAMALAGLACGGWSLRRRRAARG